MEKRWGVIFEVITVVTELKGMDEEMILDFCCSDDKNKGIFQRCSENLKSKIVHLKKIIVNVET